MKSDNPEETCHRELNILRKFSALINSSLKIEDIIDTAMEWAEKFIDAEASSIYELDEKNDELYIRFARGQKKELMKLLRIKVGEGIAGKVVKTGKPLVIHDTTKEPTFDDRFDKIIGFKQNP